MQLFAGTSGYSYKEWKGSFYPEGLAASGMLAHYASRLPAVEINNTFYRMPRASVLQGWAAEVPDAFQFVIKASRRITHFARLGECDDLLEYLWNTVRELGEHRGPLLFQLPPSFPKDLDRLHSFLGRVPEDIRVAIEFRHGSWRDDGVFDALRERGVASCIVDDGVFSEFVATADWGYLRLRKTSYDDQSLEALAASLRRQPWQHTFAFFKHEDGGDAPRWAARLLELGAD